MAAAAPATSAMPRVAANTMPAGGSENDSACSLMIRCAIAWKVPPLTRSSGLSGRADTDATLASMSSAARRVNVSNRIRLACMP